MPLNPKISINKLGEYLTATPSRRRAILVDQKNPKPYVVNIYNDVEKVIKNYLLSNPHNIDLLHQSIIDFAHRTPRTENDITKIKVCKEALENFLCIANDIDLTSFQLTNLPRTIQAYINIGGLNISVRPEIILRGSGKNQTQFSGATKLYFSKNYPLNDQSGEYIATVVKEFLNQNSTALPTPNFKNCYVIDAFGKKIYTAPRSHIRRLRDITAACQEINTIWPTV